MKFIFSVVFTTVIISGAFSIVFGAEYCTTQTSGNQNSSIEYPYYNNIEIVVVDVFAVLLYHLPSFPSPPPPGGEISPPDFNAAMQIMSDAYSPRISFNLVGSNTLGLNSLTRDHLLDTLRTMATDSNVITMYIGPPDQEDYVGDSLFNIPSNKFVVSGPAVFTEISHEMGHCLGLHHTFSLQFCEDFPGPQGCESCGDLVCDTPASPGLGESYVDPDSCSLTSEFYTAFDSTWHPSPTNHMEYGQVSCREVFTEGQQSRMLSAIEIGLGLLTPEMFQITPKYVPEISSFAEYPIIASSSDTSTVFAVSVSHPNGYSDMLVTMSDSNLFGSEVVYLFDDGVSPDLVDDDGIYTSQPMNVFVPDSTYSVEVFAAAPYSNGGNHSYSIEGVWVVAENTGLKLVDGSDATGDMESSMSGEPYANSYFKTEIGGGSEGVFVISKNNSLDHPEIYKKGIEIDGVPPFHNQLVSWFGGGEMPTGSRGACAGDFDNDGQEDFFLCNNSSDAKLYQNTGTGFFDVTSTWFSSAGISALSGSHVAAWGDYNQDGWIDLFVGSMTYLGDMSDIGTSPPAASPVWSLFRNTGNGFKMTSVVLTDSSGTAFSPTKNAVSSTWNDIDGDNDLDLLVGYIDGSGENNPQIFENQGDTKFVGDFQLHWKSYDKGVSGLSINSMDWIDYNHDEYPDLVVTVFPPQTGAYILENVADPNGGRKFVVDHDLTTIGRWEGASVGDLDQNGEEDVVLLPHSGIPAVFLADPNSPSMPFKERAFTLGLKPTSGSSPAFTSGAMVADFNNDHDLDLYLGRPRNDQFLYRNMRQDGIGDDPALLNQNWIDIDLATWGNSNSSLIGSKVTVEESATGTTWIRMVDGGSGRGGQNPNQLHFGLGDIAGPVDVYVEWPSGGSSSETGLVVNDVHLITEESVPTIYSSSLIFSHEPFPNGADWVFEWNTIHKGDIRLDQVKFQYEPGYSGTSACSIDVNRVLAWGDSDVEMSVSPIPAGWRHRVVWKGRFCSANETCHFQFKTTSGVTGHLNSSSTWKNFGYFDTCIDEIPIPHF